MSTGAEVAEISRDHVIIRSDPGSGRRVGIYARGGCHLRAIFACAPMIQRDFDGTCGIFHDGLVAHGRSDQELQTLRDLPREWLDPVAERLHLGEDFFEPRLFRDSFRVAGEDGPMEFPKTATIISIASDSVGRVLYRHRGHGLLVDPGGGWLKKVDSTLNDLSSVTWFRENFENIGMIGVDEFMANYATIVERIRDRTDSHVILLNALTIEPGSDTHNYQFVKNPKGLRWREFHIAAMELSRRLDLPVIDMDRILRRVGIRGQIGAAHFPPRVNLLIAQEAFRIMRELGVFSR